MQEKTVTLDTQELNKAWGSGDPALRDAALRQLSAALYHCKPWARESVEQQLAAKQINTELFELAKATGRDYRHIDII
ncbi:MAG TPA: hypothetical protein VFZ58_05260 [Candidatus Saccharimonadales bacterium]